MSALVPSEIINQALKQLGSSMVVSNWQTDLGVVPATARTFYRQAIEEILRDFDWPFCRVQQNLALLVDGYSRERRYAYQYPPGCVSLRRLFSYIGYNRNDDQQSVQRYIIAQIPNPPIPLGPQGPNFGNVPFPPGSVAPIPTAFAAPGGPAPTVKAILADHENLCAEFTADDTVVNDFPGDFKAALIFKLAFYMAPSLTGGDPYKVGERAMMMYNQVVQTAAMHAFNEETQDQQRPGEFIDVRRQHGAFLGRDVVGGGNGPFLSGFSVE